MEGTTATCTVVGATLTLAMAVLVASAALVAVTVTVWVLPMADGAWYSPPLVIVPIAGFTDHVTAVFVVPVTAAANCCACPAARCAELGDTLTVTEGWSTTVATPFRVAGPAMVADTVRV